VNHKNTRRQ